MNSSRRNGKPASCEPCRLNKTKCDHAYPICERCVQRGISERCFYHPAPLTKPRHGDSSIRLYQGPRPLKRKRSTSRPPLATAFPISPTSENETLSDAVPAETIRPGYLGPMSYEAILPQDSASTSYEQKPYEDSDLSTSDLDHQHILPRSMRVQMATEILKTLRYYPLLREVIQQYHDYCQASFMPLPINLQLINSLQPLVEKHNLLQKPPSQDLIAQVLSNTSRPLEIPPDLPATAFPALVSGANIRFETIGLLLSTASRSLWFGSCQHLFVEGLGAAKPSRRSRVIEELQRASTMCVMLCELVGAVNDVATWMLFENYSFTLLVGGFSAPSAWRRLGQLATQIYALGSHREANTKDLPTWLLETRRRVYCSAYLQDKTISTFLGRPPRMSKRHSDIKMPLDVSDEDIVADKGTLQQAIGRLDAQGWNTEGRYLRASWVRLRYISSTYREEILDLALSPMNDAVECQLHDISRRIRDSWAAVPPRLRYRPTCWDDHLQPIVCLMLVVVEQTHWYNEFMVQKLLEHKQLLTSNAPLLSVATTLLSNTLTIGNIRDRTYDIHRDFLGHVILFGIPAASVLASALLEQNKGGRQFPDGISRAEIIRMLSVLIGHLNTAEKLENSINHAVCKKACKTFTRIVDSVLDGSNNRAGAEGGGSSLVSTSPESSLQLDLFTAPGFDAFDGMDFMAGDDGINWSAIVPWCPQDN